MRRGFALILALLTLFSIASPVLACEPPPSKPPAPRYTNCDDLGSGYRLGFGIIGAANGTYHLTSRDGVLFAGAPEDPRSTVRISNSNGRVFDWRSTLPMDAVIVHSGGTSVVRKLSERASGEDFYGKLGSDRRPYKIDGISFCYDYELTLSTGASGTYTSAGEWGITKTVDFPVQSRFAGETAPFQYIVAVQGTTGVAAGFEVTTGVTIENNTPLKATIGSVKNYLPAWKKWVRLDCGNIRFPYLLKPGAELKCSATTPVSTKRSGESLVSVSASGLRGGSLSADIVWSGSPTGGGSAPAGEVTVTDTNEAFGGPHTVSASQSWTYTVNLTCPSEPAAYTGGTATVTLDNTAAIVETGAEASQSVTLNCYAPDVSGSSASQYDVLYLWDISKTSPVSSLRLPQDKTASIDYDVVVSVADRVETNFRTQGTVVVRNPNPTSAMTVTLQAPEAGQPLVDCASPLTIPAGESATCGYQTSSDIRPGQLEPVQVLMNGIAFNSVLLDEPGGVPSSETDECVTVYDDAFPEPLGVACADQAPATFEYQVTVGPFDDCTDTDYTNTAYLITNDTETEKLDNWQVLIDLICTELKNCTYNAAYWASHADPAVENYDATWDQAGGPSAPFYGTGLTWLGILSDSADSSVYGLLAREYIVGRLNVLRGSQASAQFLGTLDHAAALLQAYAAARGSITDQAVINDFSATRTTIKNYNDGKTGPGVCPDCTIE